VGSGHVRHHSRPHAYPYAHAYAYACIDNPLAWAAHVYEMRYDRVFTLFNIFSDLFSLLLVPRYIMFFTSYVTCLGQPWYIYFLEMHSHVMTASLADT
jgi:hypothetical protein